MAYISSESRSGVSICLRLLLALTVLFSSGTWLTAQQRKTATFEPDSINLPTTAKRYALVIGNSRYQQNSLIFASDLEVAIKNDADEVGQALRDLGFNSVVVKHDLGNEEMQRAIENFAESVRDSEGVVLFYYSGHGAEISGSTYLVPVDARLTSQADFPHRTVSAQWTLDRLQEGAKEHRRQTIMMLDSCRDAPVPGRAKGGSTGGSELDRIKGGYATAIFYATLPGKATAPLPVGDHNSVFTAGILAHIKTPGLLYDDFLRSVRSFVVNKTNDEQEPWPSGITTARFYFNPAPISDNADINQRVIDLREQAFDAIAKADSDRAIFLANSLLKQEPQSAIALAIRGTAYSFQDQHEQALRDLTEAIRLDPQYAWAYVRRARAYRYLNSGERARQDIERALSLLANPSSALEYEARGAAYSFRGDYDRAVSDFTKAIDLNSGFTLAYISRGYGYLLKGNFDAAIRDYTQAITLNSKLDRVYMVRGYTHSRKNDAAAAMKDYTQAINLNPTNVHAYELTAIIYVSKGEYDLAISDLTKAIAIDSQNYRAYVLMANAYLSKGNLEQAIVNYTRAINLEPNHAELYISRGGTYLRRNDFDRALRDFEEALRLDPTNQYAGNKIREIRAAQR